MSEKREGASAATAHASASAAMWVLGPLACVLPWLLEVRPALHAFIVGAGILLAGCSLLMAITDRFRPMLGLWSAFLLCWILVPSVYQMSHGRAAWGDSGILQTGRNVTAALLLSVLVQFCMLVGYWLSESKDRRLRDEPLPDSARRLRSYRHIGPLLIILSGLMLPYVAAMKGGLNVLFLTRDAQALYLDPTLRLESAGGVGLAVVEFLPFSLSTVGTLLLVSSARGKISGRLTTTFWIATGALLTYLYANPVANTRFIAFTTLGAIGFSALWPKGRLAGRTILVAFISVLLFLYPSWRVFSAVGDVTAAQVSDNWSFLAGQDFDGFQQIINTFSYVDAHGHTWGRYLLSALLVFIPRGIWAGKSLPASLDVAADRGYEFTNLSLPVFAEVYLELGILVALAAFGLLGWGFQRLDSVWHRDLSAQPYVALAMTTQIGIIRGPLGAQVPVVMFMVFLLAAVWLLTRNRERDVNTKTDSVGLRPPHRAHRRESTIPRSESSSLSRALPPPGVRTPGD